MNLLFTHFLVLMCVFVWNCIRTIPKNVDVPISAIIVTIENGVCVHAKRKTPNGFTHVHDWVGSWLPDGSGIYYD